MVRIIRFLGMAQAGNPHVFFTVDIGRMAPGVNDEFMVNGLVQAADRRITLFKVDDGRIVIEHFTDRKGDDFMGIYEEFFHEHFFDENGAIDQFAFLKPNDDKKGNIFAFETGYGEGFYASYIGFDEENIPVKMVTEFIEINIS